MTLECIRWRLRRSLLRCGHAFLIQTTQTALANGRASSRGAWLAGLLMAFTNADQCRIAPQRFAERTFP
jgi:hypothetical protein